MIPNGARSVVHALLCAAFSACAAEGEAGAGAPAGCRILERASSLPAVLEESSGIAGSRRDAGIFWTHNDSGHEPELYAVDAAGTLLGTVAVKGARNRDWEDIAAGPCASGNCLYIADIGDNDAGRNDVELYIVPEPAPASGNVEPLAKLSFSYPGGPRDAEALFVLPSGEIYLLSKGRDHPVALYRYPLPLKPGETVQLEQIRAFSDGAVPLPNQITAADASPDGNWVAIRTYASLLIFRTPDLLSPAGTPIEEVPLAPLGQAQGEAVAMRSDGTVVLTSEGKGNKVPASIAVLKCDLGK
jgi:hypothetical protein